MREGEIRKEGGKSRCIGNVMVLEMENYTNEKGKEKGSGEGRKE